MAFIQPTQYDSVNAVEAQTSLPITTLTTQQTNLQARVHPQAQLPDKILCCYKPTKSCCKDCSVYVTGIAVLFGLLALLFLPLYIDIGGKKV